MLEEASRERDTGPFTRHVGIRCEEVGEGWTRYSLEARPDHRNPNGVMHGGVLVTLIDTSMGHAVVTTLQAGEFCATVELKVNYLSAVREGRIEAETHVVHRGKRTAYLETDVRFAGGERVARASATFLILKKRESA